MTDPFLKLLLARKQHEYPQHTPRGPGPTAGLAGPGHAERAHSKYAASGAERWMSCPGSVALSEGLPDKSSAAAAEGTQAHEVLEAVMKIELSGNSEAVLAETRETLARAGLEKFQHAVQTTKFIVGLHRRTPGSECLVESRVYLDFIDPEMFGTFDGAVVDHFGTLHVFDYKYGSWTVSPKENLQLIFYGVGLAAKYQWNFSRVRLWIVQPRSRGYDGPVFWEFPITNARAYVEKFRRGVERAKKEPETFVEGQYCFFCKAKSICPLKLAKKREEAGNIFTNVEPRI